MEQAAGEWMFPDVETQMKRIERGTVAVFPREELVQKLERSRAEKRALRIKLGVDPTADDLHLGHAVPLFKLRDFQDFGHQVVLIIGDYTAMVGDPSGQDKTRPQLTHEQVMAAARTYMDQAGRILDMDRTEVVRNGDWFSKMGFLDVIRLAAKMTVARLLERDDFAKRYRRGSPIALHEFLYPLMQGYDSVMVRADVEIGGNDQTFNLTVGRNLQRDAGTPPQVALTLPMLVGTDGVKKMSKSLGNYIGITESPEQMFGKVMSIPDAAMRDYFELATDVPLNEVGGMLAPDADAMGAKMALARAIVTRYHGDEAAARGHAHFDRTVRKKELPEDIPEFHLPLDQLKDGRIWIVRLIVSCGLARTNAEARRLIAQGAVSIDGKRITDSSLDLAVKSGALIRAGKRRMARVVTG